MKALDVQKQFITILSPVGAIYDAPPERVSFPFMTTGDIQTLSEDTKTGLGFTHFVNLNVWSKTSRVECRTILAQAYDLLHGQTFALPGGHRMDVYLVSEQTLIEPDKQTSRGMARYRVEVRANS